MIGTVTRVYIYIIGLLPILAHVCAATVHIRNQHLTFCQDKKTEIPVIWKNSAKEAMKGFFKAR